MQAHLRARLGNISPSDVVGLPYLYKVWKSSFCGTAASRIAQPSWSLPMLTGGLWELPSKVYPKLFPYPPVQHHFRQAQVSYTCLWVTVLEHLGFNAIEWWGTSVNFSYQFFSYSHYMHFSLRPYIWMNNMNAFLWFNCSMAEKGCLPCLIYVNNTDGKPLCWSSEYTPL